MNRVIDLLKVHRWLVLIAVLSLLLKLAFLLQGAIVNPDAATYIAAAEKYSQGLFNEGLCYYRMPFYPLLLAGIHAVVPDWIAAGRALTVVPLWLTLFPLYGLTRRLFSHQSALWTALLFAVLPTFNASCADIKRDPLFLLFSVTALLFLVLFFQQHRKRQIVWFSLFAVCATLTRIEGVLLPVIALVAVPFCSQRHGKKKMLVTAGIGLVVVPLIMALVLWGFEKMGLRTTSRLTEVTSWGKNLMNLKLFAGYQRLMEALKTFQHTLPRADLHNNLIEVTRHYAPLIYLIGLTEMVVKGIFPTSLLGLWGQRWRNREEMIPERRLLGLMWLGFILLNVLFNLTRNFTTERYLWIPMVLTLPWVGEGVRLWWQRYETRKLVALLIVGILCLAPLSKSVVAATRFQDQTVVEAGRWLKQYDPQQQLGVYYNDRRLPLYAERISDVTKVGSLNSLRRSAKRNRKVELVALYLSRKKNEDSTIPGFETVKEFCGKKKIVIILKRRA
ncbi:MAG: glycosyltransferase family 39 protein [Desulfuromonas sp.]|nr:glycosyltransferase family 39 protein [Desulfuromonas sp.]